MRATLHDHAPNTYYGQWPLAFPEEPGVKSGSIARNGIAAGAGVVGFEERERDFLRNRTPAHRKFNFRPKQNVRAARR
jgi:hypothetical protein